MTPPSEPLEAILRRWKEEREAADRRYNEALTALDAARPTVPAIAAEAPRLDPARLAELNAAWNILPDDPVGSGLRGRLAGFIWRTVGPYLQRQLAFNSILVDHINRNAEAQRQADQDAAAVAAEVRAFAAQVAVLHTHLMLYLQQITAYVDTRDREAGGGVLVLNAALSDVADAQAKYRETLQAREMRYDARTAALAAAHDELRGMLGIAQQAIAALKRHIEARPMPAAIDPGAGPEPPGTHPRPGEAFAPALDAYKYLAFEDQFRGSRDAIRERQESYVPFFAATPGDVLDVGCGRGEFIELLNRHGINARGIDLNHEMAESCRARGLQVQEADAVGYLGAVADDTLGGIFSAQVVEHLEPAYLLRFLDLAFAKLAPGGTLVLETLNPACWTAFFESYIRDITHRWPLHPETLKYLVTASGFARVSIEYRSPVPARDRLQPVVLPAAAEPALHELADTVNANAARLNALMFSSMDYAVVARKESARTEHQPTPPTP